MSLLNQVLQDLDKRASRGASAPVYLAAATAAGTQPLPAQRPRAPDWLRLAVWVAVGGTVMLCAWLLFADGRATATSRVLPLPQRGPATDGVTPPLPPADTGDTSVAASPPGPGIAAPHPLPHATPGAATQDPAVAATPNGSPPSTDDGAARADATLGSVGPGATAPGPAFLTLRNAVMPPEAVARAAAPGPAPRVKTLSPASPSPLAAVRQAIARGELAAAEALLTKRLAVSPGDLKARELLIGLMLRGERHTSALDQLDRALAHHPGHLKFILIKARLLTQGGDSAAALGVLEQAPSPARGAVALRQMLGALYQQQGRYGDAVQSYRGLLALSPRAGTAWAGLAISLDALGDAEALETYRRALKVGGLPGPAATYARQRIAQLEAGDG